MDEKELAFLKEITDIKGTSGNEDAVRSYLKEKFSTVADKIEIDGMGSLMATLGTEGPKILAAGHMDEVGFMVRAITKDGYIKFSRCGFYFVTGVLSQHFTILTDTSAVSAVCSLGPMQFNDKYPEIEHLVMDVGCTSDQEVKELGIQIGDFIVPEGNFKQMGKDYKYLVNKAWDNRIGCAVSLRVMENLKREGHENIFIGGGTTQEEVGCRGAITLGKMSQADIGFSIDVGTADDIHGMPKEGISLGKGPELCVMDSSTISNRKLLKFVIKVADECGIPYQVSIMKHGGTDASKFQSANYGMPVLLVNVPSRYAHTPTSMIHYDDYVHTVKLMSEVIKRLDRKTVDEIRKF